MKKLFLTLLFAFLVLGCATAPIQKVETKECDRMVYNPQTAQVEKFICLGETISWDGMDFKLLAEAVHPETKALIGFFDFSGDREIDVAGMYFLLEGTYYFRGMLSPLDAALAIKETEAEFGIEILKEVSCLKK